MILYATMGLGVAFTALGLIGFIMIWISPTRVIEPVPVILGMLVCLMVFALGIYTLALAPILIEHMTSIGVLP